jgi:hypothetical protein
MHMIRRSSEGQVLVFFVLGILVLFGAAALGIDGSRTFEERRAAQTAVDHAATAAAFRSCNGGDLAAAQAAGLAAATRNDYNDAEASISVSITRIGDAANHTFRAAITSTIPSTFGRAIGINTFTVSVEATAGGTDCLGSGGGSGPGAIFAGGNDCTGGKFGVDVSGSDQEVYGGVHSNSDARVGGASNTFTETTSPDVPDPWTYVGDLTPGSEGNDNDYAPGYPLDVGSSASPWPAGWGPGDVGPAGDPPPAGSMLRAYYDIAAANGTLYTTKITSIDSDGVYYTTSTEGMDVSSSGGVRNVVLVAPSGTIKISGSGVTWNALTEAQLDAIPSVPTSLDLPKVGILMLSNFQQSGTERCDKYSIAVAGGNSTWNGIFWAPGGLIEMSGSSNTAVNGSLIGWAVRLNGSHLLLRYDSDLFTTSPADPDVLLLH